MRRQSCHELVTCGRKYSIFKHFRTQHWAAVSACQSHRCASCLPWHECCKGFTDIVKNRTSLGVKDYLPDWQAGLPSLNVSHTPRNQFPKQFGTDYSYGTIRSRCTAPGVARCPLETYCNLQHMDHFLAILGLGNLESQQ